MDQGPLVSEQIDAGRSLVEEFHKRMPLRIAFWFKEADAGEWRLYLASDGITDETLPAGYGLVWEVERSLVRAGQLRPDVKLVGTDDPLVRALVRIQGRHSRQLPTRVSRQSLGEAAYGEAYIYPTPAPVAA